MNDQRNITEDFYQGTVHYDLQESGQLVDRLAGHSTEGKVEALHDVIDFLFHGLIKPLVAKHPPTTDDSIIHDSLTVFENVWGAYRQLLKAKGLCLSSYGHTAIQVENLFKDLMEKENPQLSLF